jgi:hypothetical protein
MALYGRHESLKLADDQGDPAWRWFILNGPPGERFQWKRYGTLPSDIEMLEEFIDERGADDSEFRNKIRGISVSLLAKNNSVLIRTAIQVLTVVGNEEDMQLVQHFVDSEDLDVKNDARCALFERGIKLTKRKHE